MSKISPTEKAFTIAGLVLIVVGCLANAYGAYINRRFMHDPFIDPLYYFRYIILLLGGFAAGYIFVKEKAAKLYSGVFYAAFAMVLYSALDVVRLLVRGAFGELGFPWEKILLEGTSLLVVIIAFIIAYTAKKPKNQALNPAVKRIFIASFVLYELYFIASTVYYYNSETSLWNLALAYLLTPLVVALVAYCVLPSKKIFEKIFYASFIGVLYGSLINVLWEFQTDATFNATMAFGVVISLISLLCSGLLVWRVRQLKS